MRIYMYVHIGDILKNCLDRIILSRFTIAYFVLEYMYACQRSLMQLCGATIVNIAFILRYYFPPMRRY